MQILAVTAHVATDFPRGNGRDQGAIVLSRSKYLNGIELNNCRIK